MSQIDERLNQWLRDAHAMENQAEQMLTSMSSRIEHYPELATRIEQHIGETRSQRDRVEECLARRGAGTSAMKDMTGRITAMMQGVGGMMAGDEVMKGALAGYAFEHFELASYKMLAAAARVAGDTETARVCDEICREEEAMAGWLSQHADALTQAYLTRDASDTLEAKR